MGLDVLSSFDLFQNSHAHLGKGYDTTNAIALNCLACEPNWLQGKPRISRPRLACFS